MSVPTETIVSGDFRIVKLRFPDYEAWVYRNLKTDEEPWVMVMNHELTLSAVLSHPRVARAMHTKDLALCKTVALEQYA